MRVSLVKIRLDRGGYDSNGRYYGVGPPVYQVSVDGDGIGDVRAKDYFESKTQITERVKAAIKSRGADRAHYSW